MDIRHVLAQHALAAHNKIFEDFVHACSQMDVSVRVGRAIMENEFWATLRDLAQALVETDLVPPSQPFRLGLWQSGLHWEVSIGEEQGVFVFARLGLSGICAGHLSTL